MSARAQIGFVSAVPIRLASGQFRNGPANSRAAKRGNPRTMGIRGAPRRISGGATIISSMCCSMWAVSTNSDRKRSRKFAGSEARQSAHDGDKRRTQKNQRGCHHHQQHVLQHVGRQHESREGIERRSQRDPKGKKSDKKSNGAPGRQLGRSEEHTSEL